MHTEGKDKATPQPSAPPSDHHDFVDVQEVLSETSEYPASEVAVLQTVTEAMSLRLEQLGSPPQISSDAKVRELQTALQVAHKQIQELERGCGDFAAVEAQKQSLEEALYVERGMAEHLRQEVDSCRRRMAELEVPLRRGSIASMTGGAGNWGTASACDATDVQSEASLHPSIVPSSSNLDGASTDLLRLQRENSMRTAQYVRVVARTTVLEKQCVALRETVAEKDRLISAHEVALKEQHQRLLRRQRTIAELQWELEQSRAELRAATRSCWGFMRSDPEPGHPALMPPSLPNASCADLWEPEDTEVPPTPSVRIVEPGVAGR